MSREFTLLLILIMGCAISSSAQRRKLAQPTTRENGASQSTSRTGAEELSTDAADVAITATVTAKELLFEIVPNPTVVFLGERRANTSWDAQRTNLPRPVQPGITYRNIGIQLRIVSRFADIDRIVAEALGEIPVTDEVPNENTSPQRRTTPPPSQPN